VYLVINNSLTDITTVELPCDAEIYSLSGGGDNRSRVMYSNDKPLTVSENNELPEMKGKQTKTGTVELAPCTCNFIVME